jgi:hypothetical protein
MEQQHESISKENTVLTNKINTYLFSENKDKQHVDDVKTIYLKETIANMRILNNYLFGIYLLLFTGLAYLIYNMTLNIRAKVALLLVFLLYPFYINALQDNVRFIYNFLFSETTNINTSSIPESNELLNDNISSISSSDNIVVNYNSIAKENSILDTKVTNNMNLSLMNTRQSIFTSEQSLFYKTINNYLFIIYYLCVLGIIYELFATTGFPFNIYIKITITILI